jgi:uncharacterized protein (TIGR02452 family)
LSLTARETKALLPQILTVVPQAPPLGYLCSHATTPILASKCNPNLSTQVEVVNGDTFNVAISLSGPSGSSNSLSTRNVCVLNMASERRAGGGWLRGAQAQEGALLPQ